MCVFVVLGYFSAVAWGASKPHVISFGKSTSVKGCVGPDEAKCLDLKVRALYVDGRAKEFTLNPTHDISRSGCLWSAAPFA
jgi:hypothetical protein